MPSESVPILEVTPPAESVRCRYRLRFAKTGDLRLVSHHDLMHVVERMLRRAEIPFAVTQGFHPQPKMSFALSLALGVVGSDEVFDLELTRPLPPDELRERLNHHAPEGLSFHACRACEKKPSSQVRRMMYRLVRPDDTPNDPNFAAALEHAAAISIPEFLSLSECWTVRTRPQHRRINIRPFVSELTADASGLSLTLWVTPQGAARPDEIVHALGLTPLLDSGAVLERVRLELFDEVAEHERFVPDLSAVAVSAPAPKNQSDATAEDHAHKPQPTAIFDNPLSFET